MADASESVESPKSRRKLIIIVVIAVLLLGGGITAFFMMGSDESAVSSDTVSSTKAASELEAVYVNLSQPFVFNVAGERGSRYAQIKVQLMVRGSENEKLARHHSPLIESTLLATFASVTIDQLRDKNGVTELRNRATDDVKAILVQTVGQPIIEKVLFTDFVIQ